MDLIGGEWLGFPYAVRLAEDRGATCILIQPRITDPVIEGDVRPDIYAVMPSGRPLIIEVEDSTGAKFKTGGPRHRESQLLGKADFTFVIGPGGRGRCEKKLRQYFGEAVELIYLSDLQAKFGNLCIASKTLP